MQFESSCTLCVKFNGCNMRHIKQNRLSVLLWVSFLFIFVSVCVPCSIHISLMCCLQVEPLCMAKRLFRSTRYARTTRAGTSAGCSCWSSSTTPFTTVAGFTSQSTVSTSTRHCRVTSCLLLKCLLETFWNQLWTSKSFLSIFFKCPKCSCLQGTSVLCKLVTVCCSLQLMWAVIAQCYCSRHRKLSSMNETQSIIG